MMIHRAEISDPDAHAIAFFDDERLRPWKTLGVHRQDVEVGHLIGVRPVCADLNLPFVEQDDEVAIGT